jgi:fructose-specific phosphotransferase system IIC component
VSAVSEPQYTSRDYVAGVLASASIFVGAIGVAQTPVRIIPISIVLALVAAAMSDRFRTLSAWAVGLNMVWWVLGMTVAVITDNPLF